jgi:hypothetical protein
MRSSPRTILKRYDDLDEMKRDEYRYWQRQSGGVRLNAVSDLPEAAYGQPSTKRNVQRLQGPLVHLEG